MLHIFLSLITVVTAYVNSAFQEIGEFDPTADFGPVKMGVQSASATLYKYPLKEIAWNTESLTSDYKRYSILDTFFIPTINFQATPVWSEDSSSLNYKVYGHEIPEQYALEISGYFRAPETGYYEFELGAYNGAFLEFGPGELRCQDVDKGGRRGFYMESLKQRSKGPQGGNFGVNYGNWCFSRGVYYPVKIVLYNTRGISSLNLKVNLPSGKVIRDFGPEIFQATFKC